MADREVVVRKLTRVDERRPEKEGSGGLDHSISLDSERGLPMLRVKHHYHDRADLIASDEAMEGVDAIVSEYMEADSISACRLRPPDRTLLCGPPGTGKTLTAQVVCTSLGRLFTYVAFDSPISSYLGETASNMRDVFNYMERRRMAVLSDEFDSIVKGRDEPHEHGDLEQAVDNFVQMLDECKGGAVIMAATSHHGMPDVAVWGRFDVTLYFDLPSRAHRALIFENYFGALKHSGDIDVKGLAAATRMYSAAGILQVCAAALRKDMVRGGDKVGGGDVARSLAEQRRQKRMRGD